MSANDKQVGGTHYQSSYQHWDWASDLDLRGLPWQITRYASRWRKKNGLEDVRKAIHCTQKEMEVQAARKEKALELTKAFCSANKITEYEKSVFELVATYTAGQAGLLTSIEQVLQCMLATLEGKPWPFADHKTDPLFLKDGDEWRK